VVIGGTTLAGGRGGVLKTLAGTFIFGLLANGLNLLNVSAFYQYVAIGVVILVAVFLNELGRKKLISYR
jgi:ribose transport system permease protein